MAKVNYNSTATAGASKVVAPQHIGRTGFTFKSLGDVFTLNFGASASADNVLRVNANESITFTNSHKEPYDIRSQITVFCANASAFQAQAEE